MSILHTFTSNIPEVVDGLLGFPPSIQSFLDNYATINKSVNVIDLTISPRGATTKITFADQPALMSYITAAITPSAEELAAIKEWKTAYNISYTVTIEQLSDTEPTITTSYDWPYAVWPTGNWPN